MQAWATNQGLSERDVLEVVRQNMVHEDGALRFAMDTNEAGAITIKVMPKREKGQPSMGSTPRGDVERPGPFGLAKPLRTVKEKLDSSLDELIVSDRRKSLEVATPQKRQPRPATWSSMPAGGDSAAGPPRPWKANPSGAKVTGLASYKARRNQGPGGPYQWQRPAKAEEAPGLETIMDMDWAWEPWRRKGPSGPSNGGHLCKEEPIVIDDDDDSDGGHADESAARSARVHHKMAQMGLTAASQQNRLAASRAVNQAGEMQHVFKAAVPRDIAGLKAAAVPEDIERVLKWIVWLLKKGHTKLGVEVNPDGWATLQAVAGALSRSVGGQHAGATPQALCALIRRNDLRPYFELAGNSIRLAARTGAADAAQDDDLAGLCEKMTLQNAFNMEEETSNLHEPERERPPPPQDMNEGYWTAYMDEQKQFWHHYNGPLGEWWCRELNGDVLPYGEEN